MRHSLNRISFGVGQIFSPEQFLTPVLTPASATILFIVGCLAGYRYRRVWKAEGPRWQLWVTGLIAAGAFLTLGFVPLSTTS